jgi:hypothetical protein
MSKQDIYYICAMKNTPSTSQSQNPTTPFDEKVAVEAIMKTVESETTCFFKRDFECWKNCYVNKAYAKS